MSVCVAQSINTADYTLYTRYAAAASFGFPTSPSVGVETPASPWLEAALFEDPGRLSPALLAGPSDTVLRCWADCAFAALLALCMASWNDLAPCGETKRRRQMTPNATLC